MATTHLYYLHINGDLICKRNDAGAAADIRESSFARAMWFFDPDDRATTWTIAVEALALGANTDRVNELAQQWELSDPDGTNYAAYLGARLYMDGDQWCATRGDFVNLQESPAGFGPTALMAFADLAKELGLQPGKMWNAQLADLVKAPAAAESGRA